MKTKQENIAPMGAEAGANKTKQNTSVIDYDTIMNVEIKEVG